MTRMLSLLTKLRKRTKLSGFPIMLQIHTNILAKLLIGKQNITAAVAPFKNVKITANEKLPKRRSLTTLHMVTALGI